MEKIKDGEDEPNVLSKPAANIRENTKLLAELGLSPPIISRLQELVPQNVKDIQNNRLALKGTVPKNNGLVRERIKSGLYPSVNPKPAIDPDLDSQ